MKIKILLVSLLILPYTVWSQVGIDTVTPQATFDVFAKNVTPASKEGIIAPRLTKTQLASKTVGTYATPQTGTLVYVSDVSAPPSNAPSLLATSSITSVGYHYFTGTVWLPVSANLYNTNGTLIENRVVTQGDKTLLFTTNSLNGFSVNGGLFSVDGSNNRIGIGVTTPATILNVANPVPGSTLDVLSVGINNCGANCAQGSARNLSLFNYNGTNSVFAGINFIPSVSATGLSGAAISGIDRDIPNNYAGLSFATRNSTGFGTRMVIRSSGNVGIGTEEPANKLHVTGTNPLRLEGLQPASASVGTLSVNSNGVVQIQNSNSLTAVRASGNLTIASQNNTNINTPSVENFDNLNEFTGTTFTAAADGLYRIEFQINFPQRATNQDGGDGYLGFAHLIINGSIYNSTDTKVTIPEISGSASYNTCTNSSVVKLSAGNTVTFQSSVSGSSAASSVINAPFTLTIVRIQ